MCSSDLLGGFLARWLPEVQRDNRSHLTIAIGCTGGRHRSVFLAERLAQRFAPQWRVLVRHRGLAGQSADELAVPGPTAPGPTPS